MRIPLSIQILISIAVAFAFSFLPHAYFPYVTWTGLVFIKALKMIIVPLVLCSIIGGVLNIGAATDLGRLGIKTGAFYVSSSLIAIVTGLFAVNIINPGQYTDKELFQFATTEKPDVHFGDTFINIIPENIFSSLSNGNMLSIIFFAILFGFFASKLPKNKKESITSFFDAILDTMLAITQFVLKFAPLGVFGLLVNVFGETDNITQLASSLGLYFLTVCIALATHMFVSLPTILRIFAIKKPYAFFSTMGPALLTAFSTSSSSATLPLTMETIELKANVPNKITSFTLPLGATINMDGTALYECIAAVFIAQVLGYDLSIGQQILIVFTALLASIGAAGIPMAGFVMLSVILTAVGLPIEAASIVLAVDRFLDMFRTSVNVWSDSCCALIIANSEKSTSASI